MLSMTLKSAWSVAEVLQRISFLGCLVDQHRMALAERAAPAVLTAKPHGAALVEQRGERQRLGRRPVHRACLDRLAPAVENAFDLRCGLKSAGKVAILSPRSLRVSRATPVSPRARDRRDAQRAQPFPVGIEPVLLGLLHAADWTSS